MQVDTGGLPFRELRRRGKLYVDKTLLVRDLLELGGGAHLITRPRRFGKTLGLTTLDAFLNMDYEGNGWFEGLAISEHHELDCHRNAHPVVLIDLKDTYGPAERDVLDALNTAAINAMSPFAMRIERGDIAVTAEEMSAYMRISTRAASREDIVGSMGMLCRILRRETDRKVVVLVDEYDHAVTAADEELRDFAAGLVGDFLAATVNEGSVMASYIVGVADLAGTRLLSGIGDLTVDSVLSTGTGDRFGFTEDEVRNVLAQCDRPEKFEEVHRWYGGYRFGDAEVCCPFSVMCYASRSFEPKGFWADSAKDTAVRWLLERVSIGEIGTVARIVNGESAEAELRDSVTFDDLGTARAGRLYSLLAMTGYLRAVPFGSGRYAISLPNTDVRQMVDRLLDENVRTDDALFDRFDTAVVKEDADGMSSALQEILLNSSHYILRDEISYETVLLTMMHSLLGGYSIEAERETDNGRADLVLRPKETGKVPIIFELKVSESERSLRRDAEDGLRRIHDRRYYLGMHGDVILVGLAFHGKIPFAVTEVVRLRESRPDGTSKSDPPGSGVPSTVIGSEVHHDAEAPSLHARHAHRADGIPGTVSYAHLVPPEEAHGQRYPQGPAAPPLAEDPAAGDLLLQIHPGLPEAVRVIREEGGREPPDRSADAAEPERGDDRVPEYPEDLPVRYRQQDPVLRPPGRQVAGGCHGAERLREAGTGTGVPGNLTTGGQRRERVPDRVVPR